MEHWLATDSHQEVAVQPARARVMRQPSDEVPEEYLTGTIYGRF